MRIASVLAFVSILAPAAVGCSATDESAPDTWKASEGASGTRLRARFLTAGDVREHAGFYDTQRAEDCTFQAAEGEHVRCLPPTQSYASGATFFADSSCKTPIIAFPQQGCSAAKYAIATAYDQTTCMQAPLELRRVLGPATVFQSNGTGCAPLATPFVTVGDVVPWTEFVDGVSTPAPGVIDGLGETLLVGADGARQHVGFRSTKLGEECAFQLMADGVARCVPGGRSGPVFFSDAACLTPTAALVNSGASCAKPQPERFLLPDSSAAGASCNALRGVVELVEYAGSASGELYTYNPSSSPSSDATCSSVSSELGGGYGQERRALGTDLTPSLPVATRVSGRSGRLVPALVAKDDTRTLEPGWHDNERNTDCTFMVASDGKTRCLPTGGEALIFFGDDTCKSPSRVAAPTKPSCGTGSAFALVTSSTCPVTTRVFALGTERRDLPSASTETAPGRCVRVTSVTGGFDATEVDPAQFVEGALATE